MKWLPIGALALIAAACASQGRPSGGDYDIDPPVYVRSNPAIGAKNVKTNKLTITFDENVQVEDVMNKVVVSPAQKNIPSVTANGKNVHVELRDTLIPDATYTIDFSDAIRDLNEGNELDGFAIDFSTGNTIDSLMISGMVVEARTLEPAQNMLVGVYSNLADSAIKTLPLQRIGRTNQLGQFTIRGLKPGDYRIYAINDVNRDYHWDRSEDVAFYDVTISPSAEVKTHNDTVKLPDGRDTIVEHTYLDCYPNDILLSWFNENYLSQYLKDYSRPERRRLMINFSAPSDTLPEITLLNGPAAGKRIDEWARLNTVSTLDTLDYFITDTAVIAQDTLRIEMRYQRTAAYEMLTWGTDTLRVLFKGAREEARKREQEQKDLEKRLRRAERKGENIDSILAASAPKPEYLTIKSANSNTHNFFSTVKFTVDQPVESIDTTRILLLQQVNDSTWDTIPTPHFALSDTLRQLNFELFKSDWQPGGRYKVLIDSAAMTGIYGLPNQKYNFEFSARPTEDYSALFFNITGVSDSAIVEILDKSDKPVAEAPVVNGLAEFPYIDAGEYYARLYIDANGNGKYDTGILDSIQPEETYYYPNKILLKKNWDVEQSWNIYDLPIDMQKPKEIVKNKPKKAKRRRNKDGTYVDEETGETIRDEDENDGYGNRDYFDPSGLNNFGRF